MAASLTEVVAGQIRAEMARARISGPQLAERIGKKYPYLSRRLTGKVAFDTEDLAALSGALSLDVLDLMKPPERVG